MHRRQVAFAVSFISVLFAITSGLSHQQAERTGAWLMLPTAMDTFASPSSPPTATPRAQEIEQPETASPDKLVAFVEPTPTEFGRPPDHVVAPILLYHHVAEPETESRYYVSPQQFEQEMQALEDWGYHTISISELVEALTTGTDLPERPIVITFDDGHLSVYEQAFPIMRAHGFKGVLYAVSSYVGAPGYVSRQHLLELIAEGWEIGCHSASHPDLTQTHDQLRYQLLDARLFLENELGVEIPTFAYPFGRMDAATLRKLVDYGYLAAVGLGTHYEHSLDTRYYLSRIEVHGGIRMSDFGALLPWGARAGAESGSLSQRLQAAFVR